MKQNSMIKDFFMEIKKTWTRFLSILVMVMLGVAFYAGLRATSPDMDLSADAFYDDQNLMDIRVLGTLGLTDEDVEAIAEIDGLTHVQGGYSYDVFCELPDMQPVIRLMTLYENMNEVSLSEGRMPETATECVVDNKFLTNHGYKIGDTIYLSADDDEEITDIISSSSLTIVGAGSIPQYLSLERGTTTIGNGELDSFLLLLPEAFTLDAYTEICMRTEGTKEYIYTSEEYENIIEELTEKLEDISGGQCDIRYTSILTDAEEEIADAKQEIADGEQELLDAETEIADAEVEIADAEAKLLDAEKQIADGEAQIADGWDEIAANEVKLGDAKATIDSSQQEIADGKIQIEDGYAQIAAAEEELDAAQADIDTYYESVAALTENKATLEENKLMVENALQQLQAVKPQALQEIEAGLALLNENKNGILFAMQQPDADLPLLEAQLGEIEAQITALEQQKTELENQETELLTNQAMILEQENLLMEAEAMLAEKEPEIIAGQAQIDAGRSELAANKEMLDSKYAELVSGQEELTAGINEYNSGIAQLSDAKQTLWEKEQELADAKAEFKKEKADAEIEIADARAEIEDAKVEIEDGKAEIEDAKIEVADAEEELADLEVPEWYVLDRNTIATYVEYDMNSQRIDAIAKVVPALFFLVATLVCLTTMTRMVEENRIQIGTLKALGYGKGAIAAKYLAYAILATLIGSLIGLILGQKLIPVVVIQAYGILYDNLPGALVPLHLTHSVTATAIALFCMIAATLFSCYKELLQTPASLMRPASPKAGKRVLLEYVTFIWNRLSFTNKSTVRNLFRYKKRFFMTVFGIGGCMALLVVGFGVKDSIKAIGDIQFGEIRIYDGEIVIEEDLDAQKQEAILNAIQEDERITDYLPVYETSMDITDENGKNEKSAYMLVPSDNEELADYISLRDRVSQEIYSLDANGIIISEKLAKLLDVEAGDTVLLKEDEFSSVAVTVSHITENYFFHYIYMDQELYYELYGEKPEFREYYTKNVDNSTAFEKELRGDYMDMQGVEEVSYITKTADQIGDMLGAMDVLIYVIIIAAGMLAYVVLYNLNNINISERKRELATLKVLGFYDGEVSAYVFRENVLLTVCGCVAGVFLGLLLHRFIILTAEVDNMMFGREVKLHSYIYSVLLTFAFSLLVNGIMHFRLKRINMVESLKSVE